MMDNETIATPPDILRGGGAGGGRPLVPGSKETRGTLRASRDQRSDTATREDNALLGGHTTKGEENVL